MLEVVTLGGLTAFLTAVGNGAAGEMGRNLLLATGAQVRRTLGRPAPLPDGAADVEGLARQLHAQLDRNDRRSAEWAGLMRSLPGAAPALRPGAGLPPATRHFTDRNRVLKRLEREATRAAAGRPRAVLLHGPPGVGSSAVALHYGASHAARYPDGQFYVDLRDAAGDCGPTPAAVCMLLLRTMGVDAERMPPTEAAREELYRRLTAGSRTLVVVDHATSAAQVRPLLPSAPEVFLLVVSSGPAFAVEAEMIEVPELADRDAKRLLKRVAGRAATERSAQVSAELARCRGNACALRGAALRLMADEPPRASEPDSSVTDPVVALTRASGAHLTPRQVRSCRLAALAPWPALHAEMAGWAADVPVDEAARTLAGAAELGLIERLADDRYRFRPGVRRSLEEAAAVEEGIADCSAAVARVLDGLLGRVLYAAHAALPQSWRVETAPAEGPGHVDEAQGMAALLAETDNVVTAVTVAEEHRHPRTALRLARTLWPLQLKAGRWDAVLPALRTAVRLAAEHQDVDPRTAAALHFQLGHCLGELWRWAEAEDAARTAATLERTAGHLRGEASSVELRGLLCLYRWKYDEAYERFLEAEGVYRGISADQEGAADLPRALALVERHQGRALRGMGRHEESRARLEHALDWFRARGESYNEARCLTDLAETLLGLGEDAAASAYITEAERLLSPERAAPHLAYLDGLRERRAPTYR